MQFSLDNQNHQIILQVMRKVALPIFILLVALTACGKQEEKVLVRVGDETIKVAEFLASYRPQDFGNDSEAELAAKMQVLDRLIDDKLMVAEARRRGYADDTTLNAGIANIRERAMINALYVKEVVDKAKASKSDIRRFYADDKVMLDLRYVHVASDTFAGLVMRDFRAGVPFETLAVHYSDHPTASRGGVVGERPLSDFFETPSYKQLSRLKEGEAINPVENEQGGMDIFYLVERSEKEEQPPLEEMEAQIARRIETVRQGKLSAESLEKLLADARIEYNTEGLALFSKPDSALSEAELSTWLIKVSGEVVDSVGSMLFMYERFPHGVPPNVAQNMAERQAQRPALVLVARKRGLDRDPTVKDAVENFVASQIRTRLRNEEVVQKVEITPEEVRAYYDESIDEFSVPERRKLSIIRNSSYSVIQQAYSLLRQGKPFDDVAREFSDHQQSAGRGGSIGFRTANDVSFKPFIEQAFKMGKGQYSRVFEVYNGFGIVKVDDIQDAYVKEFDAEQRRIERTLRREREQELTDQFIARLREEIPVKIDENLLLRIGKLEEPKKKSNN